MNERESSLVWGLVLLVLFGLAWLVLLPFILLLREPPRESS